MNVDGVESFGQTAKGLARNPLGIIALFIVLVYGLAALVTAFTGSLSPAERLPLIWFLVIFPILVLGVFSWLVSRHSGQLFAPSDFRDEENYIRMQETYHKQIRAAASLAAASAKSDMPASEHEIEQIVDAVRYAPPIRSAQAEAWRNSILWVDDLPENNVYERTAFEAIGLRITLALSTDEALEKMERSSFAAIISDMGRREGPQEGYVLLEKIRSRRDQTPYFIYAGSDTEEHRLEAARRGAQGSINNPQELFRQVASAALTRR